MSGIASPKSAATKIYGLIDPRDGRVRYVGKTSATLHRRLLGHLNDVGRGRIFIPRHKWMKELLDIGLRPEIKLLEDVSSDWQAAERRWILHFRQTDASLLNATDGGDGIVGARHSPETIAKISASAKLRYADPAERVKTGRAVKVALSRPETRALLSKNSSTRSPETLLKLSKARKTYLAENPDIASRLGDLAKSRKRAAIGAH